MKDRSNSTIYNRKEITLKVGFSSVNLSQEITLPQSKSLVYQKASGSASVVVLKSKTKQKTHSWTKYIIFWSVNIL